MSASCCPALYLHRLENDAKQHKLEQRRFFDYTTDPPNLAAAAMPRALVEQ